MLGTAEPFPSPPARRPRQVALLSAGREHALFLSLSPRSVFEKSENNGLCLACVSPFAQGTERDLLGRVTRQKQQEQKVVLSSRAP